MTIDRPRRSQVIKVILLPLPGDFFEYRVAGKLFISSHIEIIWSVRRRERFKLREPVIKMWTLFTVEQLKKKSFSWSLLLIFRIRDTRLVHL